ncbi:MAG: acetate--CoA ligase family protein [Phycisphaerae bacterium]|nr:acetate--CoA ligase family protein [Phycisphaerae bacterium]MDD5381643.1 acetate--CoA ligase family protein [Phycisphaerae bacterium]
MALKKFFNPSSVAIVGASRTKGKVGYEILKSILEGKYKGGIFPINPNTETIEGLKCYPDLESIGQVPELVIIVVPAKAVPAVMQQCAKIGSRAVIIITAGFKEVNQEGRELENCVIQIAKQGHIRVIGPNCLGVIVPGSNLNASFGGEMPAEGTIGYISQSGALMAAILDMANANRIGFSKLVSIGNKADINELDVIKAFAADAETRVIAGYLESIVDGNTFVSQAEQLSLLKPILLMKAGVTSAGAKAASSHTGSLAGSEVAYECVFERAGIIRCSSIKQQFDYAQAFANQPLPTGSRVVLITNAGGAGIMAADSVEQHGLSFAKLSEETTAKLAAKLPASANINNPVDILGDALADRYEFVLDTVLEDEGVDIVLVLLTPQAMTQPAATAEAMVRITSRKPAKTVLACFLGASKIAEAVKILKKGKIPIYDSTAMAVSTIKVMTDYVRWRTRPKRVVKLFAVNRRKVENVIERHLRRGIREISEEDSKEILEAYGFVTPKGSIATTSQQAANIAQQLGFPVALKIWSPDILHKSDVGGVKLGLKSEAEVMDAFDLMMYRMPKQVPGANILGVLVQEMCRSGKEVILGVHRDPHFGPLMMFGMGGTMVEVLKDVAFYLAPLTAEEAKQMLVNTRTYKILKGVRGEEGVDIDIIAEGLQRLSQLVTEFPQIQEMDINPYVVGPAGTTSIAVDARISVEQV